MSDFPLPQEAAHASVAIGAFAEPLVRGRRVAVFGDATSPVASVLFERGARLVHVYDPDAGRVAEASARLASGATDRATRPVVLHFDSETGVREGAFDVVIVTDLSEWADPTDVVRRAKRVLGPSGVALFASPNPEAERFLLPPSESASRAIGYYELYDAVSLAFPEVRMLGQAPFVGYSIVDFSDEDPEVAVDTSVLAEPEAPEWYIAVGAERLASTQGYALVELPLASVASVPGFEPATLRGGERRARAEGPSERDLALTEARTRIAVLETETERLREQLSEARRAERGFEQASMRAAELEREVDTLRTRAEAAARDGSAKSEARVAEAVQRAEAAARARADADARTVQAEARAKDAERRVADGAARATDLESRLRDADARLRDAEARATSAEARRRETEERVKTIQSTVRELETKLAAELRTRGVAEMKASELAGTVEAAERRAKQRADDAATQADLEAEIRSLESALRERGHEVVRLNRDLRVAEQVGKELLFELQSAAPMGTLAGGGSPSGAASGSGSEPGASSEGRGTGTALAAPAEVDALSERAARAEADLVAAAWRVSQLEREVARNAAPRTSTDRERELESALAIAQRELADARSASPQAVVPAGVTEPLVLLEQVTRAQGHPTASSTP
jgi:SAM-dependent methyltransferase